jgi:hypothetical protein
MEKFKKVPKKDKKKARENPKIHQKMRKYGDKKLQKDNKKIREIRENEKSGKGEI